MLRILIAACLAAAAVVGCAQADRWRDLRMGMSYAEATAIVGRPDRQLRVGEIAEGAISPQDAYEQVYLWQSRDVVHSAIFRQDHLAGWTTKDRSK